MVSFQSKLANFGEREKLNNNKKFRVNLYIIFLSEFVFLLLDFSSPQQCTIIVPGRDDRRLRKTVIVDMAGEEKKAFTGYPIMGVGQMGEGQRQREKSRLALVSTMNANWMACYK